MDNHPEQRIKALIRAVGYRVKSSLIRQHRKAQISEMKFHYPFNEHFEIDGVLSLYMRKSERALPLDLHEAIKGNDTRTFEAKYEHLRVPTLELGSIDVKEGYGNRGMATFVMEKLSQMAGYYQLYFLIENVHSPVLHSFFRKRGHLYAIDRRTQPDCFWRVYAQPEKVFDVEEAEPMFSFDGECDDADEA